MKKSTVFLWLIFFDLFCVTAGIFTGGTSLDVKTIIDALIHPFAEGSTHTLIWELRIPRIVMAAFVGSGLAICGATFQAILRNPLAEPYTLGVSGGGALGATISIIAGISGFPMVLICFAGCTLSIGIVIGAASMKNFTNSMLILTGVIMSFLFSSIVMFIFAVASSRDVHASILWLMGSLSAPEAGSIRIMLFLVFPFMMLLWGCAKDMNLLSLGDEKAFHLGLDAVKAKASLLIVASLITGACVAVSGIIGFIGLMIPHFMRKAVGADHLFMLPASMLAGAGFLILSDSISQVIIRPLELPVGVITGMIGGIFFILYLLRAEPSEVM
ncbi:MAG TPA: iron ABC transporter permease [Deltaproteobacteria bacterium]|nr:iron ABC transporter permease [Deltaproteobacteria bacterium]